MAPVFFLTQQAALPSRKVLRKVIQFATALAQPIVVLVEDHRRSEDHAFAHFLSFNSDHIEKRQAEFEAWTSKFKDFVIELCEEEEVETPTLSYEHFKGSHWIAQVAKRLVDHTDLLLAGHFNKHDIQTLLTELAKNDCDLLLLSERSWPSHANMLCAIEPLHRGDAKSVVDRAIVSRGSKLEKTLSGKMTLVYCRYVAPYLSRYRAEILSNQKAGITDFISAQKLTLVPLLLPEGNPETALPKAVKQSQAAILIMGACKRSMSSQFWSGSTVDTLLDQPPCDLLLVNSTKD
ncbi:TPA: universal stress protein [Vibrio diabolicus]